ncbi:hypothetical protein [Vulgatibacter sp.]|uniref:hypothetical protein n=1 Tax=Vulgatibacter sp. TaxID=1971226 RepID=UPI003567E1D0
MAGLAAVGGLLGGFGVIAAAISIFTGGAPILVRVARALAVAGIVVGVVGLAQQLWASGFQLDLSPRGGAGQGSLFAAGGMLMLTFGATRVAERRRAARDRERWIEAQRNARKP